MRLRSSAVKKLAQMVLACTLRDARVTADRYFTIAELSDIEDVLL